MIDSLEQKPHEVQLLPRQELVGDVLGMNLQQIGRIVGSQFSEKKAKSRIKLWSKSLMRRLMRKIRGLYLSLNSLFEELLMLQDHAL